MERKWITRAYQPGDETGLMALWKAAFPDGESGRAEVDYWNWQYRDPPAGAAQFRLAVVGDQIVGQYVVIPMSMHVKGKLIRGTLSLDTMTHPAYQRQGIFTTLAKELYAELGNEGFPITYGFPNENSIGGFVGKLQWVDVCSLPLFVKPLRADLIARRFLPGRLLGTLAGPLARLGARIVSPACSVPAADRQRLCWLEQFDQRADELWDAVYDPAKIALSRSAQFLNWRYPANPLREYRILAYEEEGRLLAYAVLRCMAQFGLRGGMVVDLVGDPDRDDALVAVLAGAEAFFRQKGMDLAACLMYGDPRALCLLRQCGFLKAPRRAFKEWHFGVRLNDESVDRAAVVDPDRWHVTFGDTDII
ncbi:MAG: GNAT family N-acetyltransferase [Anaerolineae bacterium]|jgi:GNAT superfamily N-acetyltransferase